jgi:hypothetical protein
MKTPACAYVWAPPNRRSSKLFGRKLVAEELAGSVGRGGNFLSPSRFCDVEDVLAGEHRQCLPATYLC